MLSIAIPFYNEGENTENTLRAVDKALLALKHPYEILAIDNGSRDNTANIIDRFALKNKHIRKVTVPVNLGYGYGIRKGLEAAKGDFIGYTWGDNQTNPEVITKMFPVILRKDADLVKVTRFKRTESLLRRIQSTVYNFGMAMMFQVYTYDTNGCPKIFTRALYEKMKLESNDWFLDPEILIKCSKFGGTVVEFPIPSSDRAKGKSKVRWSTAFEFAKNMIQARMS